MKKKLQWNAVGIKKQLNYFDLRLNQKLSSIPEKNTVSIQRISRYLLQINKMLELIQKIDSQLIPQIENKFRIKLKTPELIYIALSRPSVKNIFKDIFIEFREDQECKINENELNDLISIGDAGNVLALIGDAVLNLAVVNVLWDSSLSTIGELTQRRSDLVSNNNLAILAEELDLVNMRLRNYNNPAKENIQDIIHEKGTLAEALIGVIYMETNLEEIERIVPMLK